MAHRGASRVSRFSSHGELLEVVQLWLLQPSGCALGGPDMRQLFITSAAVGLASAAEANGLAGAAFTVRVAVPCLPAARYRAETAGRALKSSIVGHVSGRLLAAA